MRLIIGVIIMVVMAMLAQKKGFKPWLWILAGGIVGLVVVLCMPSATADGLDEATRKKRASNGNVAGGILSALAIIVIVVISVFMATM